MEIKALVADSSSKARKNITRSLKEIGVRNVVEATIMTRALQLIHIGSRHTVDGTFHAAPEFHV